MSFLPIVERELRLAARRKSTFRVRSWTALIAIAAAVVSFSSLTVLGSPANAGGPLFQFLTGYCLLLCLLAGLFFTAETLSQERRDGTLGLLFLTNLNGFDVVLGKFAASSLNALYALVALLPVLGLPLLFGGVTGVDYWRTALALVNALFFFLALGLCVSAMSRNPQTSMTITLGLALLFGLGLPALAKTLPAANWLAWASPLTAFSRARETSYYLHATDYWGGLLAAHLVAWSFLLLAGWLLPRLWRERDGVGTGMRLPGLLAQFGSRRHPAPKKALETNPMLWLCRTQLGIQWGAWLVVMIWGVWVLIGTFSFNLGLRGSFVRAAPMFLFLLKLLFAVQACRFFSEGRSNGALELLQATPLTSREIIKGQTAALWRAFAGPLATFLLFLLAPSLIQICADLASSSSPNVVATALPTVVISGYWLVLMTADLFAVSYMGMWLSLSMKKPNLAPAATILFVLILPAFLCALAIIADLAFVLYARGRLLQANCRTDDSKSR